ncbi:voltage-gated potassium channel [Polaribacter sp. Hel1_33_78]|uniref:ion transporter n=1 Tax=Polaribacter sp. Hel1_33_78 TaxID=1336804 RepID=UPI000879F1C9|nr:ion transporter [Polaribacter sp. Hel1_33_78]SDT98696.1 voltage-gated potassium channel [Polaribacter sp. Hel1_33_78]
MNPKNEYKKLAMKKQKKILKETANLAYNLNVSTKEKIKQIIEGNDRKLSPIFDITIQVLIVFSIIIFSLGTLPNLTPLWQNIINYVDILFYSIFAIEYFLRIYVSDKRLKYIFSFFGIVDLLAILPFLFARQFDLRAIRALRVFRLTRVLKISRYDESLKTFAIAIKIIKPEITLFYIITSIFLFLSATGIYYFEHAVQPIEFASVFHSLWWAIITITTVGYGDVYPITIGGRIFTFAILLLSLAIITVPTGLIASALSKARNMEIEQKEKESKNKVD